MTRFAWSDYVEFERSEAAELFREAQDPDSLMARLADFIHRLQATLKPEDFVRPQPDQWIHRTAKLASDAVLEGPLLLFPHVEIRAAAYLRGPVLMGEGSQIGHGCEVKHSILLPHASVPHLNYVGDSVLGFGAHIGAGVILSNYRADHKPVKLSLPGGVVLQLQTRKFGAILGDGVEIGCQSVLNPGVTIGPRSRIYPLCLVRGAVGAACIVKRDGEIAALRED